MSATAWEVIPPLGISITPSCKDYGASSATNQSELDPDVSRETSLADEAEDNSCTQVDVSRDTSTSGLSEVDSQSLAESDPGASSSRKLDPANLDSTPGLNEGTNRDIPGSIDGGAGTRNNDVAEVDLPEGMTPTQSVKRILGMDSPTRPTTEAVKIIAVANQKGGVGKTTSAVNIAAALALLGYEVLLVDMDPQGNASTALGVEHSPGTISTYEVLIDGKSLLDVVQPSPGLPGLTVAPATVDLAGAEIELVSEMGREGRLKSALIEYMAEHEARRRRLDFVLVDCPPSLGLLTINALAAVDEILIPLQCEYYALEGLGQLMGSVALVREYLNPTLSVAGIVLTMYDGRTKLAPEVADEARTHFPELVYDAIIPRSVRISEAPSYSQTVLTYDPASVGAKAYLACARELVAR